MTSAPTTHYFNSATVVKLKCAITYMLLKNPKNSAIRNTVPIITTSVRNDTLNPPLTLTEPPPLHR